MKIKSGMTALFFVKNPSKIVQTDVNIHEQSI